MITQKEINDLAYSIVGCAIEVHKNIGPGLLESVYQKCLIEELKQLGFDVKSQVWIPVNYKGKILESSLKLDLLINDIIVVELKAQDNMIPLYKAQLLSYLKLSGNPKNLLINFHTENITKGLVSMVTEEFRKLPES